MFKSLALEEGPSSPREAVIKLESQLMEIRRILQIAKEIGVARIEVNGLSAEFYPLDPLSSEIDTSRTN